MLLLMCRKSARAVQNWFGDTIVSGSFCGALLFLDRAEFPGPGLEMCDICASLFTTAACIH